MDLYRDLIIDLYKNPLNKRQIKNADVTASGANVTCGDHLRIYLRLNKKGLIEDASFEGDGCAISIASASLLTEEVKGKTPAQVLKWGPKTINKLLGTELSPTRVKCGLLALETLQSGLCDHGRHKEKRNQPKASR